LIQQRFGTTVHPRSIGRVLSRIKKTSLSQSHDTPAVRPDLVAHYEQLRRNAPDASARGH